MLEMAQMLPWHNKATSFLHVSTCGRDQNFLQCFLATKRDNRRIFVILTILQTLILLGVITSKN